MKKANRFTAGFIGGGLAAGIVNSVTNKAVSSFWSSLLLGILAILAVLIILVICELFSKDEYSGTWINGVQYDLNGIEICSFPQKDGSVDYTVGYASHRLLTREQAEDFKDLVKSLKMGANNLEEIMVDCFENELNKG